MFAGAAVAYGCVACTVEGYSNAIESLQKSNGGGDVATFEDAAKSVRFDIQHIPACIPATAGFTVAFGTCTVALTNERARAQERSVLTESASCSPHRTYVFLGGFCFWWEFPAYPALAALLLSLPSFPH